MSLRDAWDWATETVQAVAALIRSRPAEMPTLAAGEHPVPLDQVHADMVPGELLHHLAADHGIRTPAEWAEQVHRNEHGKDDR